MKKTTKDSISPLSRENMMRGGWIAEVEIRKMQKNEQTKYDSINRQIGMSPDATWLVAPRKQTRY